MPPKSAAVDPAKVAEALIAQYNNSKYDVDDGDERLELISCRKIQTLWAGYGFICEVKARRRKQDEVPLILKLISPPPQNGNSGGEKMDEGHLRKMLSYEVERYFYSNVAPLLDRKVVAVARCLATTATTMTKESTGGGLNSGDVTPKGGGRGENEGVLDGVLGILMENLRDEFPVAGEKRAELGKEQVHAALEWLGGFHGGSWGMYAGDKTGEGMGRLVRPPLVEAERRKSSKGDAGTEVWLNGGYTYLATRRKEFASLEEQLEDGEEWAMALCRPLSDNGRGASDRPCVAEMVAEVLTPTGQRECESLIHGDVKSENLFTTSDHKRVAFFDFQYVGVGLGVCDLAKLFTCSVPERMLSEELCADTLDMQDGEKELLVHYHNKLRSLKKEYDWELLVRHWETALVDWHRFQVSWGQWGNIDWLEARVRAILRDDRWRQWLQKAYDECKGNTEEHK